MERKKKEGGQVNRTALLGLRLGARWRKRAGQAPPLQRHQPLENGRNMLRPYKDKIRAN